MGGALISAAPFYQTNDCKILKKNPSTNALFFVFCFIPFVLLFFNLNKINSLYCYYFIGLISVYSGRRWLPSLPKLTVFPTPWLSEEPPGIVGFSIFLGGRSPQDSPSVWFSLALSGSSKINHPSLNPFPGWCRLKLGACC